MVKTKQQFKPKKQPQTKKQGKQAVSSQFREQLDALGLKIIEVTADGNCFFRALADQIEGNEEEHMKYRHMVVQYIMNNREMFEPFIEDEVPFDEYCQSMDKDGTWAGHMELQTASLVTRSNICIHRNMSPRWYIWNFDDRGVHLVHLSYHDNEHYNSVRLKEDTCLGPARPIIIKADAELSMTSHQAKVAVSQSSRGAGRNIINAGSVKMVIAGTGCVDAEKIEQVLLQVDGNVDAAIEFLIAEQGSEECPMKPDSPSANTTLCNGRENGKYEQKIVEEEEEKTFKEELLSSRKNLPHDNTISKPDDKKIPRNQVCPCGSQKKYKACCGSVSGKSSNKFVANQTVDSKKGRKERKQGKKGTVVKVASTRTSDGCPPDLGALCI